MPPPVSIAFPVQGGLEAVREGLDSWRTVGVQRAGVCIEDEGGGGLQCPVDIHLGSAVFKAELFAYESEGDWTSVAIELNEDDYEEWADTCGRVAGRDALIRLAARVGDTVNADYVHVDEGAEAELGPGSWDDSELHGITLLRADLPNLAASLQRSDVKHVVTFPPYVVVMRRLDPVPHHRSA